MIGRLVEWSARNVGLTLSLVLLLSAAGVYALLRTPVDAIPDLSDTQVIVFTEYPGQAPQVVEDQVTFPLSSALLSVPRAQVVRGFSNFGVSFVYVIFEDGTDLYWARSRVLEYLDAATAGLPEAAKPRLGPDASGVGWVMQYVLKGEGIDLGELRALQDWELRYRLAAVEGVAEVASVGGYVRQYQVVVDPLKLRAYGLNLDEVIEAIRRSNGEVGGRSIELAETEFVLRGRGYITGLQDLARLPIRDDNAAPVLLEHVARVELGPDERRGIAELNGTGEVVSGIIVQRDGEDTLAVIDAVKTALRSAATALPQGVTVETVYDRSALIEAAIATLEDTLLEESLVVALVCFIFLLHARSAFVAIITLPIGVLIAFLLMHAFGIGSNIMSLGGIAIAVGAMVDAAIVMIENAHKRLERAGPDADRRAVIVAAAKEVGPPLFFSLLIITVSFLPVFTLEAQEGRLFKPLAFTKTFAMAGAALLSVTLVPALMVLLLRGRIPREDSNPINRLLITLYRPVIRLVLRWRWLTLVLALAVFAASWIPLQRLGREFMPTLDEGTLFFMPVTPPGLSVTAAQRLLQVQDRIIASFPEVASVLGKAGRAATATDPAPLEMTETVIALKPREAWREGMTVDRLVQEMNQALTLPGVSNSWTMPIRARIDMLSTGIRTPLGLKVYGPDLATAERLAQDMELVLRRLPETVSAYAERMTGGYFLEIEPNRQEMARLGVSVQAVQRAVAAALGGEEVMTTVEGRRRFGVLVRYSRSWRSDPLAIAEQVMVEDAAGRPLPLGRVAEVKRARGPTSIRTENAEPVVYLYVELGDVDIGSYVARADALIADGVTLPPGYRMEWSGQYEYLARAEERLTVVVPATLAIILLLLYLNFRRLTETLIVALSVPFALSGGLWLTDYMGFDLSVAVVVGFIALAGVAAETGVIMLIYLDAAWREAEAQAARQGRRPTRGDLTAAVVAGAADRVRPKIMTVIAIMAGLVPVLWNDGTGSEVMQRIAVPMIGGMVSSTVLTLLVIPALYAIVKSWGLRSHAFPGTTATPAAESSRRGNRASVAP